MKIVLAHTYYKLRGGEDQAFESEASLLSDNGHEVQVFALRNDDVDEIDRLTLAARAVWSRRAARVLSDLISNFRPDVVHFHNTLPLISPAAYYVARRKGVAVIQTLHNYRLVCPAATLFRDGGVCERCVGKPLPWPSVVHACYRHSRSATATVAAVNTFHRILGTWRHAVSRYIALTAFAKEKLVAGGVPGERIAVKPNFLYPDCGKGDGSGQFALFAGRLSPEKGVSVLLEAWRREGCLLPLTIVGDGPLGEAVASLSAKSGNVRWLRQVPREKVLELMKKALCLIVPSLCYEGFPMTVVEAYAAGLPVIASNHGSLASLVDHERTGLLFKTGSATDLMIQVSRIAANHQLAERLRQESRREYEEKYTAAENHRQLLEIYATARTVI